MSDLTEKTMDYKPLSNQIKFHVMYHFSQSDYCKYETSLDMLNSTVINCEAHEYGSISTGSYALLFWVYFLLNSLFVAISNSMNNTSDALAASIAVREKARYSSFILLSTFAMIIAPLIVGKKQLFYASN